MPILHSPGCGCSCECLLIEEDEYNQQITAGTVHAIPDTVPVNGSIDLSSLLHNDYFRDPSNIFKVHIRSVDGLTTHKTLTFQTKRDTATSHQVNDSMWDHPASFNEIDPYHRDGSSRFYERFIFKNWLDINDGTDSFESLSELKMFRVGSKRFHIKSVTSGTHSYAEGIAYSLKANNPTGSSLETKCQSACNPETLYAPEKMRYVFADNSTTQSARIIRYNASPTCDPHYISAVLGFPNVDVDREKKQWSPGGSQMLGFSFNLTNIPSDSDGVFRFGRDSDIDIEEWCLESCDSLGVDTEAVIYSVPTASQSGSGHFMLETDRVNGAEGGTSTVNVYRTGGNSVAVDVVVAVGNTDVTLSFGSGEVIKSFTISHDSHNGQTLSATPNNWAITPWFLGFGYDPKEEHVPHAVAFHPLEFVFRSSTFEFGHRTSGYTPIRKSGGYECWKGKVPFERTGWSGSSVKIYVESNVDTTLYSYKVIDIRHEAKCSENEDNIDCPQNHRCSVVPEYHSQQFDMDVDVGLPSQYMPAFFATKNDGCYSQHWYRNDIIQPEGHPYLFGENCQVRQVFDDDCSLANTSYNYFLRGFIGASVRPDGQWHLGVNVLTLNIRSADRLVRCYSDSYWNSQNASVDIQLDCGTFTDSVDYSNMPRGCVAFGSIEYCFEFNCGSSYTYSQGSSVGYGYAVGDLPDPVHAWSGSISAPCHEFTTCEALDFSTNNGVRFIVATAEAVEPEYIYPFFDPDSSSWNYFFYYDSPPVGFGSGYRVGSRFVLQKPPVPSSTDGEWKNVFEKRPSGMKYVGQAMVHVYQTTSLTPSQIASNISFLPDASVDYWFQYINSSDPSDDGFYRVTYSNTLNGPYSTADDGSGNVFYDISSEFGVGASMEIDYWWSYLNRPVGSDVCLHPVSGEALNHCPEDDYLISESLGVNNFDGNFIVSSSHFLKDVEYMICGDDGCPEGESGTVVSGYLPQGGTDFKTNPFESGEIGTVDYPDDIYFSDCRNTSVVGLSSLPVASDFPDAPEGFVRKYVRDPSDVPTFSTDTCTGADNGLNEVCCLGEAEGEKIIVSKWWDYDSLSEWSGEIEGDGSGSKSSYLYRLVAPVEVYYSRANYTFEVKWESCWTGMDSPTVVFDGYSDYLDGPDKIYPIRSMSDGPSSEPFFERIHNADADDERHYVKLNVTSTANVIDKSDITITVKPYSTQWQKY